jgi:16S rRNA processing protein RimM
MTLKDAFIYVGSVGKPHGLKGGFFIRPRIPFPPDFKPKEGSLIRLESKGQVFETQVEKSYITSSKVVLGLKDCISREQIESLYEASIFIEVLNEASYDFLKYLDFTVLTEEAKEIGSILGVASFGAQKNLIIKTSKDISYFPFIDEFIKNINIENKTIQIIYQSEFFD